MKNVFKNKNGGTLLTFVVIISALILTMMLTAGLKLVEVANQAANANERFKYITVIEDLSQTIARAVVLGRSACVAGTTATAIGAVNLCIPNTGITGVAGINGICVDLDQSLATARDRYCVQALTLVTQRELEEEQKKMIAVKKSRLESIVSFFRPLFSIASANAQCSWFTCPALVPDAAGVPQPAPVALAIPPAFPAVPGGAVVELTPSATAVPRNNAEDWSPNIATWTPATNNEIFTPLCTAGNEYWLGCIRCQNQTAGNRNVICLQLSLCPPGAPGCAVGRRINQLIAIFIRDQN